MANLNRGNQYVTFDFKHPAKGEDFNYLLRGLVKPGIYEGGDVTYSGSTAIIAPFRAFFQVGADQFVHVRTSTNAEVATDAPKNLLYMTYTYLEVEENWVDFLWRSSTDAPVTNEITLGIATLSGINITSFNNSVKTLGLFDENFNVRIDGSLLVTDDPTSDEMVGNKGFNDARYMNWDYYSERLANFQARIESSEQKLLHNTIELSYLMQRRSNYSDWMIETFFDENYSAEDWEDLTNNAVLMDDNSWNNNWKQVENNNSGVSFKNGFIRPDTQKYMLEEIERFDLSPLGSHSTPANSSYVQCISRFDPLNECYWIIGNNDELHNASTDFGIIYKIGKDMKDGKIDVQGTWYLSSLFNVDGSETTAFWSGIDVTSSTIYNTARNANEQFLFITWTNSATTNDGAGLGKLIINNDGTLGKNHTPKGGVITWTESWTTSSDFHICDILVRLADGNYYPDCTIWGNHIAILKTENNGGVPKVSIVFYEMEDNNSGDLLTSDPRSDIVGFEHILGATHASAEFGSYSLIKSDSTLWIKINEYNNDLRFIYKIDVSEDSPSDSGKYAVNVDEFNGDIIGYIDSSGADPKVIKASGRFNALEGADPRGLENTNEGISISHDGHLLEITSTNITSYPKVLHKRAISGALWAENQVYGQVSWKTFDPVNLPYYGSALHVEDNRYYWTSDIGVAANECDVFRYDTLLGTFKHVRLVGANWGQCFDITSDGTTIWFLGTTLTGLPANTSTTPMGLYFDTLDNVLSAMGDSYNIANTYNLTTGTLGTGLSGVSSRLLSMDYDSDNNILYLLNDTGDSIDTISVDGATYISGVIPLPKAATYWWQGLAYNNNKLYVVDYVGTTLSPALIYEIDILKSSGSNCYVTHRYQDSSPIFGVGAHYGTAMDGNNLVHSGGSLNLCFTKHKVLEDPDVLQLHVFLDSNNILLSDYVYCQTPIVQRYFEPEDFTEYLPVDANSKYDPTSTNYENIPSRRNVPDMNYMAVGYSYLVGGMSVLHLDKFLSGKSSTGKDRRDVRDIRYWHFEPGGTDMTTTSNILYYPNMTPANIFIEKDQIIIGNYGLAGVSTMIDLKNGKAFAFYTSAYSGMYYNGTLSERNEGKGYTGKGNPELDISHTVIRKIHARTFTKDDESDYNGKNPKTFVALGTDGGCDVMVIDWDDNGNRNITKVYNNVFGGPTHGNWAIWIAPSGTLFGGEYAAGGGLTYGNSPIWELNKDSGYSFADDNPNAVAESATSTFITELLVAHVMDISHNSRCWKLPDGTWRHQLVFGTLDNTDLAVLGICDVENRTVEKLWDENVTTRMISSCDNYEDLVMGVATATTGYIEYLMIMKKTSFNSYYWSTTDITASQYYKGWYPSTGYLLEQKSRPYMYLSATSIADQAANGHTIRYSKDYGILSGSGKVHGLQFFLLNNYKNNCVHESVNVDTDNPTDYYYIQSTITSDTYETYED